MHRTYAKFALALALSLVLSGCGSDEPEATPVAQTPAPPAKLVTTPAPAPAAAPKPAAPQLPVAQSAYERAQRALTEEPAVRLQTEFTAQDGTTQYLTGSRQLNKYAFAIRTLPKPDNSLDGSWVFQNGRYLKQQGQTYDQAVNPPNAISAFIIAVAGLPDEEGELSPDRGALDSADGVSCQPRMINLSKSPTAAQSFTRLVACVDEGRALIVKLSAETRTGDRLVATLSNYGEAVEMPQTAEVQSWENRYPRK